MSRSSILLSLSLLLLPVIGFSQVNSVKSGDWETPATWSCNCIPDSSLGQITINSNHTVTITTTVTHDDIVIQPNGILTIANGGRLIAEVSLVQLVANPPTNPLDAKLNIEAGGIVENLGSIQSIQASMIFESGSEYQHNQQNGKIPSATWQSGSTCRITGWQSSSSTSSDFKGSLSQSFQNFIWDSPGQGVGNVTFLGSLTTVNGNLIINNTNGNRMVSLGGNNTVLNVGGDFIVNSSGRVSVAVSGGNTFTMNVLGNCILSSTSGTNNYQIGGSGATGITNLNIIGNLTLNSGQLNLTTGLGAGNINITGNLFLTGGSIIKLGTGAGTVSFVGSTTHNLDKVSGTFTAGNLVVKTGSALNFIGNPLFMVGNIIAESGATLNLPAAISTSGDLQFNSGSIINSNNGIVTLTGTTQQVIDANGAVLHNITLNKTLNDILLNSVQLNSPLSITGELLIPTQNTVFASGGKLRLRSTSDSNTGNARIGQLTNGASISGAVTTERFMSPEGRIYRYISSPVTNPPVSQLQDNFPVTGPFTGSSTCTGCSTNASLFYYNAATAAYVNYPAAITDQLVPGRGYAAYVRQDIVPFPLLGITVGLTGPINQGNISLPVFHNPVGESWNLVGNPYPSSIDWDDANWTKTNISVPIAVRDNGTGMFLYWDGLLGDITNGVIAAGQGFWVRTTGSSPALIIQEQAKSTATGEFFRKSGSDFISMTITKGALYDKAYIQLREGAGLGLDDFDAPKLVNDNFDFSTRFANTSQLAINAVNNLPCGSELFLDLRFTKTASGAFVINPQGSYNVAFDIAGSEFDKYKISLLDQFTGTQIAVTSGFTYAFSITSNPASLESDRLRLRFEGILPSLNLDLAGADVLCGSKVATVIVKNSDSMFEYFLLKGGEVFSDEKSGNGGDLSFAVPGASLLPGSNQVEVGVKGVCGVEFLANKWEVTRYQDVSISVEEGDILVSNYTAGNQWYLNDDLISGVNSQTLKVKKSGKYSVEVNSGECTSRADIDYAITGMESEQIALSIYPNPFKDKVYLASKELFNPATKVSIYNSLGQEVFNQSGLTRDGKETGYFNMGNLTDGVYFVRMNSPTSKDVYKILKLTH